MRTLRCALVVCTIVAAGLTLGGTPPATADQAAPFTQPLRIPPVYTKPNLALTMREACVPILPGPCTKMWTYDGVFPGPTIRRPSGRPTRVTFTNDLPAEAGNTTVHHHGNHSESQFDGQPDDHLIARGKKYTYEYDFMERGEPERAAFQWYHDHRMDVTGRNVWMGLAGMFVLDDDFDAALALPKGEFDVPLMVVDRSFDAKNQLNYKFSSTGATGDTILVNGVPSPYFDVADRTYRLRLLNASNFREYRFEFANGQEMVQVASESGLLPEPVRRKSIVLGPAERAEVVVNFAGLLGENIVLSNTIEPLTNEMTPVPRQVMQFRVRRHVADNSRVPDELRPVPAFGEPAQMKRVFVLGAIPGAGATRHLDDSTPQHFLWTINGRAYEHDRIDARPKLGATERWVFVNPTVGQHRIHLHDVDWKIVSRTGGARVLTPGDPDAALGESGLRETFLVQSGEKVEVETTFTDRVGTYVFHCHILEHEDNGMMAQFQVTGPPPRADATGGGTTGAESNHRASSRSEGTHTVAAATPTEVNDSAPRDGIAVADPVQTASRVQRAHAAISGAGGASPGIGAAIVVLALALGAFALRKNQPWFARFAGGGLALQLLGLGWDVLEHARAGEPLDLFENSGHLVAAAGIAVVALAVALPSRARAPRT